MHFLYKRNSLIVIFLLLAIAGKTQIIVTENSVATQLAQQLVGSGVTISNATLSGSPLASGIFINQGGNSIGINNGIVLSTGKVLTTGTNYGVNGIPTNFASESFFTPGDAQLSALINGIETNDAVILEFDFIPQGNDVSFRYVFSSEEYPGFTCSNFNDVFAFFISGPGITGSQNIALIPGTNIPVAINSVNDDNTNDPQCTGMGPGSPFPQYYVNNASNASSTLTHNGHTVVFTATASVTPCQTYHLKIAIADGSDESYDSAVFLEAGSLSSPPLSIVENNLPVTNDNTPFLTEGCTPGSITIARPLKLPTSQDVSLIFGGTAANGVDINLVPTMVTIPANDSFVVVPITAIADNIAEGLEQLRVYIALGLNCSTIFSDSIFIDIRDQVMATTVTQNANCLGSTGEIALTVPDFSGIGPYTYSLNGGDFQTSNVFTGLDAGNYVVTVRDSTGCLANMTTIVELTNDLTLSVSPMDTSLCVGASFSPTVTSNGTSYSWTPSKGINDPLAQNPNIAVSENTTYTVTASLGSCTAQATVNATVFPGVVADAGPDQTVILGAGVQLQGSSNQPGTYLWTPSTGLSATNILNPIASPQVTTTYQLRVTTPEGCVDSSTVLVTLLEGCDDPMAAFTPNGDGINDVWLVTNPNCLRNAQVQIFNRYGAKVYESSNYQNNWDGTYKGKPVADGTYYYVVSYTLVNNARVQKKGNISILR